MIITYLVLFHKVEFEKYKIYVNRSYFYEARYRKVIFDNSMILSMFIVGIVSFFL